MISGDEVRIAYQFAMEVGMKESSTMGLTPAAIMPS
jgi:hypothetical protein